MTTVYKIGDKNDDPFFDAAIELSENAVILHSRGGATGNSPARNTQYNEALSVIIRRLRNSSLTSITRVLLDSSQALAKPVEERVLVSKPEFQAMSDSEFQTLIRRRAREWGQAAGTEGGNSTKRIRIEVTPISHLNLRSTLLLQVGKSRGPSAPPSSPRVHRLPHSEQRKVLIAHIHKAVDRLLSGEDASNFNESTDYDVITKSGTRLPPKKVFGLALEEALGISAFPGHFSAGQNEPSFEIIRAAGYLIVPKSSKNGGRKAKGEMPDEGLPASDEDLEWAEGQPKRVEHLKRERAPGIALKKKAAFFAKHKKLYCENCKFAPADTLGRDFADACLDVHHTLPIALMPEGHKTSLDDLTLLCANCHRIEHRRIALSKKSRRR